ncbi:MAG: hypothetical protein JWO45_379 [Spartobacteria bacterium]|nr:hypothetical protein [Spartobacteria bacterium]
MLTVDCGFFGASADAVGVAVACRETVVEGRGVSRGVREGAGVSSSAAVEERDGSGVSNGLIKGLAGSDGAALGERDGSGVSDGVADGAGVGVMPVLTDGEAVGLGDGEDFGLVDALACGEGVGACFFRVDVFFFFADGLGVGVAVRKCFTRFSNEPSSSAARTSLATPTVNVSRRKKTNFACLGNDEITRRAPAKQLGSSECRPPDFPEGSFR